MAQMPYFWSSWMYKISPYTYLVQNLLGIALHDRPVICDPKEFNVFQPPSGMTCKEFAGPFVKATSGYIDNETATSDCRYSNMAQILKTINAQMKPTFRHR